MSFTVEDLHDLVQLLEERQDWRAEIRRLVLTDTLLALPERIEEQRRETDERIERLRRETTEQIERLRRETNEQIASVRQEIEKLRRETNEQIAGVWQEIEKTNEQILRLWQETADLRREIAELRRDFNALDRRVQGLADDVGQLKGESLERRYRERGPAYFGRMIRGTHVLTAEELDALLADAVNRGALDEPDKDEIILSDLVVRGRSRDDGADVFLVVEVSTQVEPHDVERAVRRARLLEHVGAPAWPVVAGHEVTESATLLMRAHAVWQVLDGRAGRPTADLMSP